MDSWLLIVDQGSGMFKPESKSVFAVGRMCRYGRGFLNLAKSVAHELRENCTSKLRTSRLYAAIVVAGPAYAGQSGIENASNRTMLLLAHERALF